MIFALLRWVQCFICFNSHLLLLCYDEENGEEKWKIEIECGIELLQQIIPPRKKIDSDHERDVLSSHRPAQVESHLFGWHFIFFCLSHTQATDPSMYTYWYNLFKYISMHMLTSVYVIFLVLYLDSIGLCAEKLCI